MQSGRGRIKVGEDHGERAKMNRKILTQSLFSTTTRSSTWRSHVTSSIVHALILLAALVITFPMIREQVEPRPPRQSVTLVAPEIPEYRPKIVTPRQPAPETPVSRPLARIRPTPAVKPAEITPPPPKPAPAKSNLVASAPEIRPVSPAPTPPAPAPKMDNPAPKPAPQIHVGTFESADRARGTQMAKKLAVGGFGDPNGVPPSPNSRPSEVTMAKVGSFDLPDGGGTSGDGGRNTAGGVKQSSFGSMDGGSSTGNGSRAKNTGSTGLVRTGNFADSALSAPPPSAAPVHKPVQPAFTPVEILSKPKPAYTQEARNLKLEGQVSLEVVFLSNGSVRVIRIVRGLGHGLDKAAEQAALQVRFRPATRAGVPVDTNATINITFELT